MDKIETTKEIDVIKITIKILKERKSLACFLSISMIIGIIIAINSPKVYTSDVVLAPEISSGGLGLTSSLSSMASSFGIDIGSKTTMDAIYPEIYPVVLASTDFILDLFNVPVHTKNDIKTKTYYQHIVTDGKVPFWVYPRIWIASLFSNTEKEQLPVDYRKGFLLSRQDEEICKIIRNSITCFIDNKTSIITISVTDMDPIVAATIADTLQNRLQEYITNYRTQKARKDLIYYQKLYSESKQEYIKARKSYSSYSDSNQELLLQSFKSKQEEMENEMQLRYNAYTQWAAQLENAKAKIQEVTPAFTIIQKATVPNESSSMPRTLIVAFFMLIGFITDVIWILFGRNYCNKKKKCNI